MRPVTVAVGQRFGRLVVIGDAPSRNRQAQALCRCDCGRERTVAKAKLAAGHTSSCGCLMRDALLAANRTHGRSRSREHAIWRAMKNRCSNPKVWNYDKYGGRGIRVCDRWLNSFENFLADMGERPSARHSIERERRDGNYEPDNCHWALPTEQAANRSNERLLTARGETLSLTTWAHRLGAGHTTILARLRGGWAVERAVTEPVRHRSR